MAWSYIIKNKNNSHFIFPFSSNFPESKQRSNHTKNNQKEMAYPETKTPVPSRNINDREAPKMSKTLSGLTENGFGSGGLKLDGGLKPSFGFSSVLTEVEGRGVSENSDDALMDNTLEFGTLRRETGRSSGDDEKLNTAAIFSRSKQPWISQDRAESWILKYLQCVNRGCWPLKIISHFCFMKISWKPKNYGITALIFKNKKYEKYFFFLKKEKHT